MPTQCTLSSQPTEGVWSPLQRTFTPTSCIAHLPSPREASRCLRNKKLVFMGDSQARNFGLSVGSFLAGVSPADALTDRIHLGIVTSPAVARRWEDARPQRSGKNIISRMLNGSVNGGYTDAVDGWTVQVIPRSYSAHWTHFLNVTRNSDPNRTLVFASLGVHATTSRGTQQRWISDPIKYFVHGPYFQPFLDHHCAVSRSLVAPPLYWMTIAEQCTNLKSSRYSSQVFPISRANNGTVEAARKLGFPLLDWSAIFRDPQHTCFGNHSLSADGVHPREWVEHTKAQLLASYICAAESPRSAFRPEATTCSPCVWPELSISGHFGGGDIGWCHTSVSLYPPPTPTERAWTLEFSGFAQK